MIIIKKIVKIIGGIALGLAAAVGIAISALSPLTVEATTLQSETAGVSFTEQGILRYDNSIDVYPMVFGELLELRVSEGDKVKKGDALAVISAKDTEYEILQLESAIKGYNAQINNLALQEQQEKDALIGTKNNLTGQLASLEAQITGRGDAEESRKSQIELQKEIILRDRSIVNLAGRDLRDYRDANGYGSSGSNYVQDLEYNALREAYNMAEKALAASELQLAQLQNSAIPEGYYEGQRESLQAQIDSINSRLGKSYTSAMRDYYAAMIEGAQSSINQLNERKGQATVTSPVDGIVSELPAKDSNIVNQGMKLAAIGSSPVVEVFVPIRELDGVKNGDTVELIVDKRFGDEVIAGTVTLVEEKAQVRLSALGVEERKIRVLITPQESNLYVGFNMDVKFTVLEQQNSIIVPKTAVFEKDSQDMVWVIENGSLSRRAIQKGIETREGYAISSGLSAGETVVTDANNEDLAEGKRAAAAAK